MRSRSSRRLRRSTCSWCAIPLVERSRLASLTLATARKVANRASLMARRSSAMGTVRSSSVPVGLKSVSACAAFPRQRVMQPRAVPFCTRYKRPASRTQPCGDCGSVSADRILSRRRRCFPGGDLRRMEKQRHASYRICACGHLRSLLSLSGRIGSSSVDRCLGARGPRVEPLSLLSTAQW
jgi:hypothetical protein